MEIFDNIGLLECELDRYTDVILESSFIHKVKPINNLTICDIYHGGDNGEKNGLYGEYYPSYWGIVLYYNTCLTSYYGAPIVTLIHEIAHHNKRLLGLGGESHGPSWYEVFIELIEHFLSDNKLLIKLVKETTLTRYDLKKDFYNWK